MQAPKIHAFSDERPHSADDLNAMGVGVLELVAEVNYLRQVVRTMREELDDLKAAKPAGRAAK